ncbi:MAG: hypothetical protein AAGI38_14955, partial [Bacteroidota bacterium]
MNFTNTDIKRLYGNKIFILPKQPTPVSSESETSSEASPEVFNAPPHTPDLPELSKKRETLPEIEQDEQAPPAWYLSGEPITWKMRASSTLALVMSEEEFSNRMLTYALKQCVEDAGIPAKEIGFGVFKGSGPDWNFQEMPTAYAVIFSQVAREKDFYQFQDKHIYLQPRIQDIA